MTCSSTVVAFCIGGGGFLLVVFVLVLLLYQVPGYLLPEEIRESILKKMIVDDALYNSAVVYVACVRSSR